MPVFILGAGGWWTGVLASWCEDGWCGCRAERRRTVWGTRSNGGLRWMPVCWQRTTGGLLLGPGASVPDGGALLSSAATTGAAPQRCVLPAGAHPCWRNQRTAQSGGASRQPLSGPAVLPRPAATANALTRKILHPRWGLRWPRPTDCNKSRQAGRADRLPSKTPPPPPPDDPPWAAGVQQRESHLAVGVMAEVQGEAAAALGPTRSSRARPRPSLPSTAGGAPDQWADTHRVEWAPHHPSTDGAAECLTARVQGISVNAPAASRSERPRCSRPAEAALKHAFRTHNSPAAGFSLAKRRVSLSAHGNRPAPLSPHGGPADRIPSSARGRHTRTRPGSGRTETSDRRPWLHEGRAASRLVHPFAAFLVA